MENLLEILTDDNRAVNEFLVRIREQEIDFYEKHKDGYFDRTTLFPSISVLKKDNKTIFVSNVRKKDKDGVWWRAYHTEYFTDIVGDMGYVMRNFVFKCYNFHINGIVPSFLSMGTSIDGSSDFCVKCAYQWLSEEDRMAAISSFMTPAEYVINKYKK